MDRNQRYKNTVKKNDSKQSKALAIMEREQPKVEAIRLFRTKPYESASRRNEEQE